MQNMLFSLEMLTHENIKQGPVVQSLDSAIHQINPYPMDKIFTNSMQ